MSKINKKEEIEKLKQVLVDKIKKENDSRYADLSVDEAMRIAIDASSKGKYVFWIIREYIKGNIQRFEDMSRVKQALTLFKNNLSKFDNSQKQLGKMSFQELENLISPYQDVLTQNAIKRMNKEKIWEDIDVVYNGPEGRIYVPKTREASIFLGQGTKWCTAATGSTNMFNYYNARGPLYVFILPEKDEIGREIKYQLHIETNQFMDMQDKNVNINVYNERTKLISILIENLSMKQKIKHFFGADHDFFDCFGFSSDLENILFREKLKITLNLNKIPKKFRTEELYKLAVQQNGEALSCVPANLITKKLCELAVKQNGLALEYVPYDFITKELCELIVQQDGYNLQFVPEKFQTKNLSEIAVTKNGIALKYVPTKLKTYELCEIAVKQNGLSLCDAPQELITKDLSELAVTKNGGALKYIPLQLITRELCELAVRQNGLSLYYVPAKFQTKELCKLAVQQNGEALGGVPDKLKTHELCELAVEKNGHALHYVPKELVTKNLSELAVTQNSEALCYVPDKFATKELCELAVEKNGHVLKHVPAKFQTKELCELAVQQHGCSFRSVSDELATKELCELAVRNSGYALSYIPVRLKTKELCELAVGQNGYALHYVPEKFKTKEMCEIAAQKNINALSCVPDEFKTKKLLEICVKEENRRNNVSYSFEEILEMTFSENNNQIKEMFEHIKTCLIQHYIELRSEQLSLEFDLTKKYSV